MSVPPPDECAENAVEAIHRAEEYSQLESEVALVHSVIAQTWAILSTRSYMSTPVYLIPGSDTGLEATDYDEDNRP